MGGYRWITAPLTPIQGHDQQQLQEYYTMSTNQKPFDKVVLGSIQLAIWKNTNDKGNAYYSVTFEKRYRDTEGEWKSTSSLNRDDLLVLAQASEMAFRSIHDAQAKDRVQTVANAQAQQQTATAR